MFALFTLNNLLTYLLFPPYKIKMQNFKRSLLLTWGVNFKIFDLPAPTQSAFWFMLFHWIDCNRYTITITPNDEKTCIKRSVENTFGTKYLKVSISF